jgi:hypothetical protein
MCERCDKANVAGNIMMAMTSPGHRQEIKGKAIRIVLFYPYN